MKKNIILILVCLTVIVRWANGQNQINSCDSLKTKISETEDKYLYYEPFDSSINRLNTLVMTADRLSCSMEKSTIYVVLGYFYTDNGVYTKALESLQQGLVIRKRLKDTLKTVSVYNNLIRLENFKNFPQHGLLYADTALTLLNKIQNDPFDLSSKIKINKSNCLRQLGRIQEARDLLEEVAKDTSSLEYSSAIQGLGDLEFEDKSFEKALEHYKIVKGIYDNSFYSYDMSMVSRSIGLAHLGLKDTTTAIRHLFISIDTAKTYDYKLLYLDAYFELVRIIPKYQGFSPEEKKAYETEIKALIPKKISVDSVLQQLDKRGGKDSLAIGSHQERADIRNQLAELFRQEGDFEKAYAYQKGILPLEANWVKQMEKEKELVADYKAEVAMEKERSQNRQARNFLVIGLLSLIILSLVLYLKNRKLAFQKVTQSLEVERQLRRQLSFETHDIKTLASGVRNFIQFLYEELNPPAEINKILQSTFPLSEKLVGQLERLTNALEPATDEWYTLLELLFDRLKNENQFKTKIQVPQNLHQLIDEGVGYRLFTILDVLTENIRRHAEATELQVILSHDKQKLTLIVEDNGKGNFSYPRDAGTGLKSVGIRVQELDGSINVNTQIGTKILIEVPLKN